MKRGSTGTYTTTAVADERVEAVRVVVGVYRTGLAVVQADPGDREPSYVMKTCVLKPAWA